MEECYCSGDGIAMKTNGLVFVVGFGCTGIASSWTIAGEWIFVGEIGSVKDTGSPYVGLHGHQFCKNRIIGIIDNARVAVIGFVLDELSLV